MFTTKNLYYLSYITNFVRKAFVDNTNRHHVFVTHIFLYTSPRSTSRSRQR